MMAAWLNTFVVSWNPELVGIEIRFSMPLAFGGFVIPGIAAKQLLAMARNKSSGDFAVVVKF